MNRFVLEEGTYEIERVEKNISKPDVTNEYNYDNTADNIDDLVQSQQSSLENQIINIESQVAGTVLNNVETTDNFYDEKNTIITEKQQEEYEKELNLALIGFMSIIIPVIGAMVLNKRQKEFGLISTFKLDNISKQYIKEIASKASRSHLETIVNDLYDSIKETYNGEINKKLKFIEDSGRKVTDADLKLARKLALEGDSRQQIVNAIKNEYSNHISTSRAKAIARTETNRAFTQAQYQADRQFLQQNNLENRAFKKWVTTNDKPCATCLSLESQEPIPFERNFANLGDELVTTYEEDGKTKKRSLLINFEPLSAGNAHVNCMCKYILIIK